MTKKKTEWKNRHSSLIRTDRYHSRLEKPIIRGEIYFLMIDWVSKVVTFNQIFKLRSYSQMHKKSGCKKKVAMVILLGFCLRKKYGRRLRNSSFERVNWVISETHLKSADILLDSGEKSENWFSIFCANRSKTSTWNIFSGEIFKLRSYGQRYIKKWL
jgi:hypothetical protein